MTPLDLHALRKICEAARDVRAVHGAPSREILNAYARFEEAFGASTALALLDRIEKLERVADAARLDTGWATALPHIQRANARILISALAALDALDSDGRAK